MLRKSLLAAAAFAAAALATQAAWAADLVRLGNLKFAHYGAVSYMKEIACKYDLKIEERDFPKGIDILPAIVAGEIDVAASAVDAAIAGRESGFRLRASGVPIYAAAGFAKGGARIVAMQDAGIKSIADLKGKKVTTPHDGSAPEFNRLKRELSQMVMEEQQRFSQDEIRSVTAD